ncbi:transposase family protein [Actinomadura sp. 21ATH]|uniref:transposase family protein n=1 Tax=Actinomadura sp. 21ATH TaxID=1735444 RepID=UPI0035BFEACA
MQPPQLREHGIVDALTHWAIACFADKGHAGAGGAVGTPYKRRKGRKLSKRKQLFNRHRAKIRALGEQGAATLKTWHILRKARCSPKRVTADRRPAPPRRRPPHQKDPTR